MIVNKKKIYESPDSGITIRGRDFEDTNSANTITISSNTITIRDNYQWWSSSNTNTNTISNSIQAEDYMWSPDSGITIRGRDFKDTNSAKVEFNLHKQYPELKEKWKEYQDLEMHYKAWELLKK